jgi:hypothetical protein
VWDGGVAIAMSVHRKQFRRRCFKSLAILFAMIAAIDLGLWIRAQFVTDRLALTRRKNDPTGGNASGFNVEILDNVPNGMNYLHFASEDQFFSTIGFSSDRVPFAGNVYIRFRGIEKLLGITILLPQANQVGQKDWDVAIAHRTIVVSSLVAFALLARLGWKEPFKSGQCPACGYDLRASPERCPECGALAAKAEG